MEGIAKKISRLPPALQREVEDYVDFLLSRKPPKEKPSDTPDFLTPPSTSEPSKPIILADEIPFKSNPDILPGYKDLEHLAGPENDESPSDPPVRIRKTSSTSSGTKLLDWID